MARRYDLVPKSFTFTDGEEHEREVSVDDPQEAYEAFRAFTEERGNADVFSIADEAAEQALLLLLSHGAVARIDGADNPKTEYCAVANANRYWSFVMLFVEDGYAGLDHAGQWFPDIAHLAETPEQRGERRAAAVSTEREAIDEVCRIWADSGIVDPSNQYYVFFDTHTLEVSRAERAELVKLIQFLGLERVESPADAADGEVWVRTDPRIDAELEQWS